MSDQKWFYERDGARQGPVSSEAIRAMAASGVIRRNTVIWRDGLADWIAFDRSELCTPPGLPHQIQKAGEFPPARQPKLNPNFNFGIFKTLGDAWNLLIKDFWPMIGCFLVAMLLLSAASSFFITIFFLTYPLYGGFLYYTLRKVRGENATLENVFDGFKRRVGSLAMLSFLATVPLILCLVPVVGIIFYVEANQDTVTDNPVPLVTAIGIGFLLFMFLYTIVTTIIHYACLLCMDCDIGWAKATGLATKMYFKRFFKLFFLGVVISVITFVSVFALYVGSLVAMPWVVIAYSLVYEEAFREKA